VDTNREGLVEATLRDGSRHMTSLLRSRWVDRSLCVLVVFLFATANLPWHLDDYDQAKQAYVSYEIIHTDAWLFQHTPTQDIATKPPLAGWISAGLFKLTGSWALAWRLPSFVSALFLLWILRTAAKRISPGQTGTILVTAAFALNLMTPRLATLVRTDMMLTLFIFLVGWMIWRKLGDSHRWTLSEKLAMAGAMLGALYTKGPILYAFVLPGLILFSLLPPKDGRTSELRSRAWGGVWIWLIPLACFAAWVVVGLVTNREFYQQVVVEEFLSRFHSAGKSDERGQPVWFYGPHLIHKFLPWSLVLILAPALLPTLRAQMRRDPQTWWLVCWTVGSILVMTIIPSKRVDRIYPVLPPLCLLLVHVAVLGATNRRMQVGLVAAFAFSMVLTGGYFGGMAWWMRDTHPERLIRFAGDARAVAAQAGLAEPDVVRSRDEGLLMYLEKARFLSSKTAKEKWASDPQTALVLSDREAAKLLPSLPGARILLERNDLNKNEKGYVVVGR